MSPLEAAHQAAEGAPSAAELVRLVRERHDSIRSFDMVVQCSVGSAEDESPHVQRVRLLQDGNRWALKWSPDIVQVNGVPNNYRIGLEDGLFTFHHHPLQARVRHALLIQSPARLERSHELVTHSPNVGSLWYDVTRNYVWEHAAEARVTGTQDIEGVECTVVEFTVPREDLFRAIHAAHSWEMRHGALLRLYVAPALRGALPRYEYCTLDGHVDIEFVCSGFQEVNGVVFPSLATTRSLRRGRDGARTPALVGQINIERIESINEPIPDDEFDVVIPPDTTINDSRPGHQARVQVDEAMTFKQPDEIGTWIEKRIASLRPSSVENPQKTGEIRPLQWMLVVGNVVALIVATALVLFRRWRKR